MVDLIIVGRIATLRDRAGLGWVEAIAVRRGRVVAAGAATDIEALADPRTTMWHVPIDEVVAPSLTDAHLHLVDAALAARQPDLTGLDRNDAVTAVAAAHHRLVASGDRDGWLLGHGWTFAALGEHPDARWLDDAAPGRPVALWAHDHHSRWISTRAVRLAGLAEQIDPPSGRIERDAEARATGVLYEIAAGLVDAFIPEPGANDVEAAVRTYAHSLAGLGITSVHDPGGVAPDPQLHGGPLRYRAMAEAGRLPLRVMASVREDQLERAIEIGFRSGLRHGPDDPGRYRDGWLKLFSDGALGSRTAALLAPYEPDDPAGPPPGGPTGMALRSRAQLSGLAERAAAAGIAVEIHAIGDAAVRTVLDVIEALPQVEGAMHRVEHAQLVDPADVSRFGTLGIPASVQPGHLLSDAAAMHTSWGGRSAMAFPLADIDRDGSLLPFGTDAPVESADPWPGIAAAVTRRGPGWLPEEAFYPAQAISLERALRAACLDGPRSARIGDEGHLDVGARADLVVLPARLSSEPHDPAVIASVRPQATLLDGEVVHRAPDFDP
jgi:predicted amidohydrolase YtcJ